MRTMIFRLGFQNEAFQPVLEVAHAQPSEMADAYHHGREEFIRREFAVMVDKLLEKLDDDQQS